MKNAPINGFGTKLMSSSRAIHNIPYHFLTYAKNLRVYDGSIGARKGFYSIYEGTQDISQGGFSLNGSLYQVQGGKIWKLNELDKTRTEIATLGHSQRVDTIVYQNTKGAFTSLATENFTYDCGTGDLGFKFEYLAENNTLYVIDNYGMVQATKTFATDNTGYPLQAVKLLQTGTPTFYDGGSGFDDGTGIILSNGQYARPNTLQQTGNFDIQVGHYTTSEIAIISSTGQDLKVFDGINISDVTINNTGIIEFSSGRSWLSSDNVLLASRPITLANPEYAYDFTGTGSYNIVYDSTIGGIKATLGGLYVFTQKKVEYISAGNSTSGLSLPIGDGGNPINNLCIISAGERICYLTKSLEIETVNFIPGINDAQIGKLSNQKIVNIREYLQNLDTEQPLAFGYNNKKDNTVQFFLRTIGSAYNNVVVVYDIVNDTWNIDEGRNFNYVVEHNSQYYTFSDLNSSVYLDDIGYTDNGYAIECKGITQNMNFGMHAQKLFGGFYVAGGISQSSEIDFSVYIDEEPVFQDSISGTPLLLSGGIGSSPVGGMEIGGESFEDIINPFTITADEGRIWQYGDRVQIVFESVSEIQNWILDTLGLRLESVSNINIENKF